MTTPWVRVNQPWNAVLRQQYLDRGARRIVVDVELPNLEWVRELPDLAEILVHRPVGTDDAVFDVPTLEMLLLFQRSRNPLRVDALPRLRELEFLRRTGLASIRHHPSLESIGGAVAAKDRNLEWLGVPPRLRRLNLEGRGSVGHEALKALGGIQDLTISGFQVDNWTWLEGLTQLRHLYLDVTSDLPVDAALFEGLPEVEFVEIGRGVTVTNVSTAWARAHPTLDRFAANQESMWPLEWPIKPKRGHAARS